MSITQHAYPDDVHVRAAISRTCARLLRAGVTAPTVGQVLSVTSEDPALAQIKTGRQAARRHVVAAVIAFLRPLELDAGRWRLVGRVVTPTEARNDLLFEDQEGNLLLRGLRSGPSGGVRGRHHQEIALHVHGGKLHGAPAPLPLTPTRRTRS